MRRTPGAPLAREILSALIVIMGVMTGLQDDLREKILIGSPDVRVMTMGSDMVMKGWEPVLKTVRAQPGVVAALRKLGEVDQPTR